MYPCLLCFLLLFQGTRTIIDNTDSGLGVVPINTRYDGFIDCFTSILKEEGLQGLYRGMGALMLQYAIHALILRMAKLLFEKLSQELSRNKKPTTKKSLPGQPSQLGGFGEGAFRWSVYFRWYNHTLFLTVFILLARQTGISWNVFKKKRCAA